MSLKIYSQSVVFEGPDEKMITTGQSEFISCRNHDQHWKADHLLATFLHVNADYLTYKVLQSLAVWQTASSRLGRQVPITITIIIHAFIRH